MLAAIVSLSLFAVLVLVIGYFGYRQYARPARFYDGLHRNRAGATLSSQETAASAVVRVFRQIGEKLPVSPRDASMTRRFLIAAGLRSDPAVGVYYGIKAVACLAGVIAALIVRESITTVPIFRILLLVSGGLAGYFGPNIVLDRLVSRRQEAIRFALPDALDLMVVCVEAGLGLDHAILSVSQELNRTHPALSEEFYLAHLEMQAGKRRAEALSNMAKRTGEPNLRKLVSILIQTDRFGTSMADSLRTHSDFMRVRRRQEAEERAGKVGVKLVFPIFFFILPSMFIVVAGSPVLQLFKSLIPVMKQAGGN